MSNSDKQSLSKIGDKSRSFVVKALSVAQQNPEMLPMRFDLTEFEQDVELFQALHPVSLALNKLNELVEGTLMAIGSDGYNTALDVYAYAKLTEGVTGLEGMRSALGTRQSVP